MLDANERLQDLEKKIEELEQSLAEKKADIIELGKINQQLKTDIEKRLSTENQLRNRQQQILHALESSKQGIWIWDINNDLSLLDNKWLRLMGYEPDQVNYCLDWWLKNIHPDDLLIFEKTLRNFLEGKSNLYEFDYRLKARDGNWQWINVTGIITEFNDRGEIVKMIGIHRHITGEKEAADRLKEVEERYKALFERSRDAVFIHDYDGLLLDVNRAGLELTGYDAREVSALDLSGILSRESLPIARKVTRDIFDSESFSPMEELTIIDKKGRKHWLEVQRSLIYKDKKPFAIQGMARDVTRRILADKQLKEANSLLSSLIQSPADVIIYSLDKNCRYTSFNQAHAQDIRKTIGREIRTGDCILDMLPDKADQIKMRHLFLSTLRGESKSFIEQTGNQDNRVWHQISCNPIFDEEGTVTGLTVFAVNITKRMLIQEELRQSEETFRALAENSPDIIIRLDKNLRYVYVNPAFERISSTHYSEIIGKTTCELTFEWGSFATLNRKIRQVFQTYRSRSMAFDFEVCRKTHQFQARMVPETDDEGRVEFVLCVIRDITDLKRVEKRLQQAHDELEERVSRRTYDLTQANLHLQQEIINREQTEQKLIYAKEQAEIANRAKSEFLANISHELRTPMHHILNYSKFGIQKIEVEKEKLLHYFTQIRTTSNKLMELLNDLLDLSKLESGKQDYNIKPNNLGKTVNQCISDLECFAVEKEIRFLLNPCDINLDLEFDAYKIEQVINNLLLNSIKYSPRGKAITISFQEDRLTIENRFVPAVKTVVMDEGVGIPTDEINMVFEKFYQSSRTKTGAGGTGLGLAISRKIIEDHHGLIWASNNKKQGTKFSFLIPLRQTPFNPSNQDASVRSS